VIAAEDVQRQVAVLVVVAVKKAIFLLAIQRRVGHIQIEHDLVRSLRVRFQKDLYQQSVQSFRRVGDLMVAILLARQRFFDLPLAGHQRQKRIATQLLRIIQILIS
jgi:hypothetical protein